MAVLDINEYESLAPDTLGLRVPTGKEPAVAFQQLTVTASSGQSAAFGSTTRFIRVHSDGAVRLQFGTNPTAAATTMRIAAGATEFFGVTPGQKLAAITTT